MQPALPDHLKTRQGREPVFYKLEQIIKSRDGEDALDCWSDTTEDSNNRSRAQCGLSREKGVCL